MSGRAGEGGPGLHLLLWQRDLRCKLISGECLLQRFAVIEIGQSLWVTLAVGVTFHPKGFMEFWSGPGKLNVFNQLAQKCIEFYLISSPVLRLHNV